MSNENSNLRVGSAGAGLFVGSTKIMAGVDNVIINNPPLIIANNTKEAIKNIKLIGDTYEEPVFINLEPGQIKFINVDITVFGRMYFTNNVDCHIGGMYYNDNEEYGSLNEEHTNKNEIVVFNYYWACCVVLVINNYYTT